MAEDLIRGYREQAEAALKAARMHYDNWDYVACVHQFQLAVELLLKALLKKFAGDFPRKHDVSEEIMRNADKFPDYVSKVLSS